MVLQSIATYTPGTITHKYLCQFLQRTKPYHLACTKNLFFPALIACGIFAIINKLYFFVIGGYHFIVG